MDSVAPGQTLDNDFSFRLFSNKVQCVTPFPNQVKNICKILSGEILKNSNLSGDPKSMNWSKTSFLSQYSVLLTPTSRANCMRIFCKTSRKCNFGQNIFGDGILERPFQPKFLGINSNLLRLEFLSGFLPSCFRSTKCY